jgi:hypothetical protein
MPPEGFEPAIPASERPQTHALDSAATGIGFSITWSSHKYKKYTRRFGNWICFRPQIEQLRIARSNWFNYVRVPHVFTSGRQQTPFLKCVCFCVGVSLYHEKVDEVQKLSSLKRNVSTILIRNYTISVFNTAHIHRLTSYKSQLVQWMLLVTWMVI